MAISRFFRELRKGYQSEIDDLSSDSEGKNVLKKRLAEKHSQLKFLLQMIEFNPEMVAVIFHQGFIFRGKNTLDYLVSQEDEDLPSWLQISEAVGLMPWAQKIADQVLMEPEGERLMVLAAGLEYLHQQVDHSQNAASNDEDDEDENDLDYQDDDNTVLNSDDAEAIDPKTREQLGADWMEQQGFDRKD
jgi:hypothetical protein